MCVVCSQINHFVCWYNICAWPPECDLQMLGTIRRHIRLNGRTHQVNTTSTITTTTTLPNPFLLPLLFNNNIFCLLAGLVCGQSDARICAAFPFHHIVPIAFCSYKIFESKRVKSMRQHEHRFLIQSSSGLDLVLWFYISSRHLF